ncbi:MAG: hypothetical protein WBA17_00095 [Saprospiraceae bacterium]
MRLILLSVLLSALYTGLPAQSSTSVFNLDVQAGALITDATLSEDRSDKYGGGEQYLKGKPGYFAYLGALIPATELISVNAGFFYQRQVLQHRVEGRLRFGGDIVDGTTSFVAVDERIKFVGFRAGLNLMTRSRKFIVTPAFSYGVVLASELEPILYIQGTEKFSFGDAQPSEFSKQNSSASLAMFYRIIKGERFKLYLGGEAALSLVKDDFAFTGVTAHRRTFAITTRMIIF